MKKLFAIPILVVASLSVAACTPEQIAAVLAQQQPPVTSTTSFTIPDDLIMRWECPAPVPPLYLNTRAYRALTPAQRRECWAIPPRSL